MSYTQTKKLEKINIALGNFATIERWNLNKAMFKIAQPSLELPGLYHYQQILLEFPILEQQNVASNAKVNTNYMRQTVQLVSSYSISTVM